MNDLEVGQVLSLRIRFNNDGAISRQRHPYLIVSIDEDLRTVEIAQLDSLAGKEYKAAMRSNKVVYCDDPQESVIDKDSYVQLDNILKVELFENLKTYRRQTDKLSVGKLHDVLLEYQRYHEKYHIDENKQVYMSMVELESLQ